jgi:probable F420-dependent oxidoreductase
MRFSIGLPTDKVQPHYGGEFVGQTAIAELARAAEAAGFDACHVTDHPFPTERWMKGGGHHAHDPFVALAFAAAATRRIRLQTNILVLPYRNPFLTARSAASLDALSDGRLILGVAAGYLKAEFRALGVDFDSRNERSDEAIRAIKAAWTQDVVQFKGTDFEALGNVLEPKPVQKPHPPIWVGGNSTRAIRRAVELGDGWLPFLSPELLARTSRTARLDSLDELRKRVDYLREHCARLGRRAPLDIAFTPFAHALGDVWEPARVLEQIPPLRELGISWLVVGVPCRTRREFADNALRFGQEVVAKARA